MVGASSRRGWLQIVVTLAVVASFLVASTITWLRTTSMESDIDDIVGNAMPSIEMLAGARSQLRRLETDVERYAAGDAGVPVRTAVMTSRQDVEAALDSYAGLPFFEHERELYQHVRAPLEDLDRDLPRVFDLVDRGAPEADAVRLKIHTDVTAVDDALSRIIDFDAKQGQRLARSLATTRSTAAKTALALNLLCVGLAVLAAVLAVSAVRADLRRLERARDTASERAAATEQRNAELEQFAGRVAHDVLSPLMGVALSLEMAKVRLPDDPKAQESIRRGMSSLLRARRIVDGLLEFARAGARPPEGASSDVREVVRDVVDAVNAEAQASGIDLLVPAFEPCQAACSPGVLTSLVANLVRNAIKHMGDAKVRAVTVRVSEVRDNVRVEVEDTGPGIPKELESVVFEPFMRGATQASGIGLGLATVKRLATSHGGRAGCRSQPGAGSTFWFELPRGTAAERSHAVGALRDATAS